MPDDFSIGELDATVTFLPEETQAVTADMTGSRAMDRERLKALLEPIILEVVSDYEEQTHRICAS